MMAATLFDTALGRCGIAWAEGRIRAIRLPEATDDLTAARLYRNAVPDEAAALRPRRHRRHH